MKRCGKSGEMVSGRCIGRMRKIWGEWKRLSEKVGRFQGGVFLIVFYIIFLPPFALGVRLFTDSLRIKIHHRKTYWMSCEATALDLTQYKRQF